MFSKKRKFIFLSSQKLLDSAEPFGSKLLPVCCSVVSRTAPLLGLTEGSPLWLPFHQQEGEEQKHVLFLLGHVPSIEYSLYLHSLGQNLVTRGDLGNVIFS